MRPSRRMSLALLLLSLPAATACKAVKRPTSDLNTIADAGGKDVFALLPMRNYMPALPEHLAADDARRVETSLRLTYGVVQCTGDNARPVMDSLLGFAEAGVDSVRRSFDRLVITDSRGGVVAESCKVVGSYVMGPASFARLFSAPARDRQTFEMQQIAWIALRGRYAPAEQDLPEALATFLAEHFGAKFSADNDAPAFLRALDTELHPCETGKSGTFDKMQAFKCPDTVAAIPLADYSGKLRRLVDHIAGTENRILSEIGAEAGEGYAAALTVNQDPTSVRLKRPELQPEAGTLPPPSTAVPTASTWRSPFAKRLQNEMSALAKRWRLSFSGALPPVYTASYPLVHARPPRYGEDDLPADPDGPWIRLDGNHFQAQFGDRTFTAYAAKNADDSVAYEVREWRRAGDDWYDVASGTAYSYQSMDGGAGYRRVRQRRQSVDLKPTKIQTLQRKYQLPPRNVQWYTIYGREGYRPGVTLSSDIINGLAKDIEFGNEPTDTAYDIVRYNCADRAAVSCRALSGLGIPSKILHILADKNKPGVEPYVASHAIVAILVGTNQDGVPLWTLWDPQSDKVSTPEPPFAAYPPDLNLKKLSYDDMIKPWNTAVAKFGVDRLKGTYFYDNVRLAHYGTLGTDSTRAIRDFTNPFDEEFDVGTDKRKIIRDGQVSKLFKEYFPNADIKPNNYEGVAPKSK